MQEERLASYHTSLLTQNINAAKCLQNKGSVHHCGQTRFHSRSKKQEEFSKFMQDRRFVGHTMLLHAEGEKGGGG